jgi:predicted lysophospholipase L1 biosynthesis ABC-type transport system permease subunit
VVFGPASRYRRRQQAHARDDTGHQDRPNLKRSSLEDRSARLHASTNKKIVFKRRDILLQFLFEAVALSVLGGVVGVILGLVAAFVFAHVADWSLIVDTWAVASSVVFSMVVGILFGWYPALRASRLEPIEAIRTA